MFTKILTVLFGLSTGFAGFYFVFSFFPQLHWVVISVCALLGFVLGYLFARYLIPALWSAEESFQRLPFGVDHP